jgi:hypothetical protein
VRFCPIKVENLFDADDYVTILTGTSIKKEEA